MMKLLSVVTNSNLVTIDVELYRQVRATVLRERSLILLKFLGARSVDLLLCCPIIAVVLRVSRRADALLACREPVYCHLFLLGSCVRVFSSEAECP
jgi:hypothetical protein